MWPGGNLEGYRSADSYVGIFLCFMGKRQIDIYIDESGNFAPFAKQNPVYEVESLAADSKQKEALMNHVVSTSLRLNLIRTFRWILSYC